MAETRIAEDLCVWLLPVDMCSGSRRCRRRVLRLCPVVYPHEPGANARRVGIRSRREGGHEGNVEVGAAETPDGRRAARLSQRMVRDIGVEKRDARQCEERQCTW